METRTFRVFFKQAGYSMVDIKASKYRVATDNELDIIDELDKPIASIHPDAWVLIIDRDADWTFTPDDENREP